MKRRLEGLEREIETIEKELDALNEKITRAGEAADVAGVTELGEEYREKDARLKDLWQEWETLGEETEP